MNILIVDDKPNLARVTAVALRTLECQAFTAATTKAALHLLDTKKIDAVFLDVNLGGENGLDFLSHLAVRAPQPPVIIFTAQSKDEVVETAIRRGAFDCLSKPFTLDELRRQLARIRQHHRAIAGRSAGPTPHLP